MHVGMTCLEFKVDRVNKAPDDEIIAVLQNVVRAKQCTRCKFWVEKS